jgi:hypothetical protein
MSFGYVDYLVFAHTVVVCSLLRLYINSREHEKGKVNENFILGKCGYFNLIKCGLPKRWGQVK